MRISSKDWKNYIEKLSKLNNTAGEKMSDYVARHGFDDPKIIDYAYGLVTKYGEGSASLSAMMYDAIAEMEGKILPPAEVAETPEYGEVAKAVNGVRKHSQNPTSYGNVVNRLVKRTGADTMLKNAERDGAEFAWIPSGDTCAFCIALASRGWQHISKNSLKNGHAEHIHANCDCNYTVRFDGSSSVAGYNPDEYLEIYENAEGNTPEEKINSIRAKYRAENKDKINAQKRAAYALKNSLDNDEYERNYKSYKNLVQEKALDAEGFVEKFKGITNNEKVNEALYNSAVEILKHRNGTDFADIYFIDANSGEIIHKLTTCDLDNRVKYDAETWKAINKAHNESRDIITIHNHPGGLPPSLDDGVSAYKNNYVQGVVVGHNLEVYSYSSSNKKYKKKTCQRVHNKINQMLVFSVDDDLSIWYNALKEYGMEVQKIYERS